MIFVRGKNPYTESGRRRANRFGEWISEDIKREICMRALLYRYFDKKAMSSDHLRKGHVADGEAIGTTPRSLKLATAMYNADQLSRTSRNGLDG